MYKISPVYCNFKQSLKYCDRNKLFMYLTFFSAILGIISYRQAHIELLKQTVVFPHVILTYQILGSISIEGI